MYGKNLSDKFLRRLCANLARGLLCAAKRLLLGGVGAWLIKFCGHALWRNKIYEPPRMGGKIFEATIERGICGVGR